MNRIYKFQLPKDRGKFPMALPEIQYTLHIDVVDNDPYMWAVVDTSKEQQYYIYAFWTGDPAPDMEHMICIGTAIMDAGRYVVHYYREETR